MFGFDNRTVCILKLKDEKLFWFKSKNTLQARNKIELKHIQKVQPIDGDRKFEIKFGSAERKDYEFFCDNKYKRDTWVKMLNDERKKIINKIEKKFDTIFELEEKKKDVD